MTVIVFFHAGVAGWSSAFIALDMFFVLSGFLVAQVVLTEIDETGRFDLGRFYARRIRRLLPAAIVAIVGTSILWVLIAPQTERVELVRDAQAALVWLANWNFIAASADYFAADVDKSPFLHYWSLSIEEQYYLLFPAVVLLCLKFAPGRTKVLLGVLAALAAVSVTAQIVIGASDPNRAYFGTDTRAFQLLAGAVAAIALREFARPDPDTGLVAWRRAGPLLAVGGALGYLLLGSELIAMSQSWRNVIATPLAVALVLGMFVAPRALLTRGLSLPAPVYLGKITYATYLWHWPLVLMIGQFFTVRPAVVALLALSLAFGIAALSYELLERPVRRSKRLDRFGWPVAALGVATSVAVATVVVVPVLESDRSPSILLAADAADRTGELAGQKNLERELDRSVGSLDLVDVQGERGPSAACAPGSSDDCLVVDGDGPHIVLVGDSHARMWGDAFAAIAEDQGFRFSMSVAPGCPFQVGVSVTQGRGGERAECQAARDGFYDQTLPEMEPDLVVFAGAAKSRPGWHGTVVGPNGNTANPSRILSRTTRRTVDKVRETGAAVVFLGTAAGTDGWGKDGFDPLDCLATADRRRDCAVVMPQERPDEDAIYTALAVEADDVAALDPTFVYCPDAPVCTPVVEGQAAWRNPDHLNARALEARSDVLWRKLERTGLLTAQR